MNKKVMLSLFSCVLLPFTLFAIGVNNNEVPLHDSLPISGSDLDELGYLDVTASGYGADPTGTNDSTAAIRKAITNAYDNNMVVYFPAGTYKVTDSIDCWQNLFHEHFGTNYGSQLRHANVLVGSTAGEGVTIKLADNASGFNSESAPKNLFQFWCTDLTHPDTKNTSYSDSTRHYNAEMRNFKIDLGTGNSGAIGIWMLGAQGCDIQDVDIDINSGFAGIAGLVGAGTGHAKITLRNGKYGVWCDNGYMDPYLTTETKSSGFMPYLVGCTFLNQRESAIYLNNLRCTLTLMGFKIDMTTSYNKKAIVLCDSYGDTADSINLVDGTIVVGGTNGIAVANDGRKSVNMENVFVKANKILDNPDGNDCDSSNYWTWGKVNSLSYIGQDNDPYSLKCNPAISIQDGSLVTEKLRSNITTSSPYAVDYEKMVAMHLWKCDFPTFEDLDCYVAEDLDRTGATDVTAALQDILDEYDKVFLPKGVYKISAPIELAKNKALFGIAKNLSILKMDPSVADPSPDDEFYMVETVDNADSGNIVAFLEFQQNPAQKNIASLKWRAGKTSIIRNIQQWYSVDATKYRNLADFLFTGNGGGKLYNFHHTYNIRPDNTNYVPAALRFYGVSQPTYVYGLSSECAWFDGQLDIVNSRDVYLVAHKDENANDDTALSIKTFITGSTNIAFYGMSDVFHEPLTNGVTGTFIYDSDDIAIFNLARVIGWTTAESPATCSMLRQDADGNGTQEFTEDALNAFSKYDLGSFARNITGSAIYNIVPSDTFVELKDYWSGSNGFSLDSGRGKLASGALDYLGSFNYDNVKVFYDFEDTSTGTLNSYQCLRAKIRAQKVSLNDCYEVRLERDKKLKIYATRRSDGSQVAVTNVLTGLSSITGATHHMDILVRDLSNGDTKVSATLSSPGISATTLTWTQSASDSTYKHLKKGTIAFQSSTSCTNYIDNFYVKDGLFY